MAYDAADIAGPLGRKLLHASEGHSLEAGTSRVALDGRLERRKSR